MKAISRQLPILVILSTFIIYALSNFSLSTYEFNADEGINLIKADLVLKGYTLYKDVWNDQPPLLTILLASLFKITGPSVEAARLLVLGFSCMLLWNFHQILSITLDRRSAAMATALLAMSWEYAQLSVSIMIGIPSLAFAVLSIHMFHLSFNGEGDGRWSKGTSELVLSGVFFAISLQTKLFTAFLTPLFLIPAVGRWTRSMKTFGNGMARYSVWACVVVLAYTGMAWMYGTFDVRQIVSPHFSETMRQKMIDTKGYQIINSHMMSEDFLPLFLAFVGVFGMFLKNGFGKRGLLPLAWFILIHVILYFQIPVRAHYYPLASIPLCWLSGYGIHYLLGALNPSKDRGVVFGPGPKTKMLLPLTGLLALASLFGLSGMTARQSSPAFEPPPELMKSFVKNRKATRWLVTDKPMFAFRNGMSVPPECAVFSQKRMTTDNLGTDGLARVLDRYDPEQIVLFRFTKRILSREDIRARLKEGYRLEYLSPNELVALYVRKDLTEDESKIE